METALYWAEFGNNVEGNYCINATAFSFNKRTAARTSSRISHFYTIHEYKQKCQVELGFETLFQTQLDNTGIAFCKNKQTHELMKDYFSDKPVLVFLLFDYFKEDLFPINEICLDSMYNVMALGLEISKPSLLFNSDNLKKLLSIHNGTMDDTGAHSDTNSEFSSDSVSVDLISTSSEDSKITSIDDSEGEQRARKRVLESDESSSSSDSDIVFLKEKNKRICRTILISSDEDTNENCKNCGWDGLAQCGCQISSTPPTTDYSD